MSNDWPFTVDDDQIDATAKDDVFNRGDEDDIFFTDKPRLPVMIKNKPIKRFLPDFNKDQIPSETDTSMKMVNKRQLNNETNKCKWTKSKGNAISSRFLVKTKEMKEFFRLTDDPVITDFLKMDSCKRIADKYLIAMVFAYFKRAAFEIKDYNRTNFFLALYLANDVEEDEEEIKYEIFPWALGKEWRDTYADFLRKRDWLFRQIDYKAIISRKCCDEIMSIMPDHSLWKRERPIHHAGALRNYMKDPRDNGIPRGPDASPLVCSECDTSDSQYDSSSPNSLSWLISTGISPAEQWQP